MELIRCFIAIELPEDLKTALAELQTALGKGHVSFVKWVEPKGIHLTLKFLGQVSASTIEEITLAMEEAATGIPPFNLRNSSTSVFPNPNRVKVIWVGLTGDVDMLISLQKRLGDNIGQLGFPRESRAFTPHLTIARIREDVFPEERQKFGQRVMAQNFDSTYEIPVKSISLMKSQLTPGGAIYSRLALIDFKTT